MDDDEIRKRINDALGFTGDDPNKQPDEVKEISDLMGEMPSDTRCETVVNSYYRRRLTNGALLVVKNSFYVDQDRYMVHKIRIEPSGVVAEDVVRCRDDVESLRESVMFLNGYEKSSRPNN